MQKKIIEWLSEESKRIEKVQHAVEKDLRHLPKGGIEVNKVRNKYYQYYLVVKESEKTKRIYLSKKKHTVIADLIQRAYEERLLRVLNRRNEAMVKLKKELIDTDPYSVFQNETEGRKAYIRPMFVPESQYIENWYKEMSGNQNTFPMEYTYATLKGEKVRSKSEKMIADNYYLKGIPYVYEPSLKLKDGRNLYPDFAVLNVSDRKTYYHEHFGMMDDPAYRAAAVEKMRDYNKSGFWLGEVMLYTFEGRDIPFEQEEMDRIIEHFLAKET